MPSRTRNSVRFFAGALLVAMLATGPAGMAAAQNVESYTPPRTIDGQPDFRGVWSTLTITPLERPPDVASTRVGPERAKEIGAQMASMFEQGAVDPDFALFAVDSLIVINGEHRAALIISPEDGQLPYTAHAQQQSEREFQNFIAGYDNPEQRPMSERCIGGSGAAPMRLFPVLIPREIFQTRDHVVIRTEDVDGTRIVYLDGEPPPQEVTSVAGYAAGEWDGDTLVVRTTHLPDSFPYREGIGRAIQISGDSVIVERFTRVAEDQILYQFTVEDPGLYTSAWRGEYLMARQDTPVWEYACHEANYSMPTILVGGRTEQARLAAAKEK